MTKRSITAVCGLVACGGTAAQQPIEHHTPLQRAPNVPALQLLDQTCRLLAAKKYTAAEFTRQIGSDPTRALPEQHMFAGDRDQARIVPPSPTFTEMFVTSERVSGELFNQITLSVDDKAKLTVGELRTHFPSVPTYAEICDAHGIQDLILKRAMPGTKVTCEVVVTVPYSPPDLDAVTVREVTIQE